MGSFLTFAVKPVIVLVMFNVHVNPVLLRDCRQMVHSRIVVMMIGIFLFGMIYAVCDVFLAEIHAIPEAEQGRALFWRVFAVMSVGTLVAVLLSSAIRTCSENGEPDPMFLTLLTPRQIVMGKLLGGLVVSALFYSMALPFLAMVYLLRGVDLLEIVLGTLGSFLLIQSLHTVCLAFFSGAKTPIRCGLAILLFLVVGGPLGLLTCLEGAQSWWRLRDAGKFFYSVSILITVAFVFMPSISTLLAIAQYSPSSSNRMFSTRLFLTLWGILFVPIVMAEHVYHDHLGGHISVPLVMLCSVGGLAVMILMNLIAICERDEYSWRTRQEQPKSLSLRVLTFPLSSGSVNGFCWTFLATAFLAFTSTGIAENFLPSSWSSFPYDLPGDVFFVAVLTVFVFDYSATAFLLHRLFLKRWIPRDWAWTIPPVLLVGTVFGTYFLGYLIDPALYRAAGDYVVASPTYQVVYSPFQYQTLLAPNPLTVFDDGMGYRDVQIACAFGWAGVLALVGLPWCVVRFRKSSFCVYRAGDTI